MNERGPSNPTVVVRVEHVEQGWDGGGCQGRKRLQPESIPPLKDHVERNLESTRRAVKAGVRIAMGSDAVFTMFGQNTRELGWFVKAGTSPSRTIRSPMSTR